MKLLAVILTVFAAASCAAAAESTIVQKITGHPRLYFTSQDLPSLRDLRTKGHHAVIWRNLDRSAKWCLTKTPRTDWIAPVADDPIYSNLYDRFYAMMQDMAITEHLAFAYSYSGNAKYGEAGRKWTLSICRVWKHEADGEPDASKAYAVMRMLKGVAVGYDCCYDRFTETERQEIRDTLVSVGHKYYEWYVKHPEMAGEGQNKHHGSVEAASFGVTALAILGEVPEASDWLDLIIKRHTDYLLRNALTESGTYYQSSNFWASSMQYRIFFMDALRRVTGLNLFRKYARYMDGRVAFSTIAGPGVPGPDQAQQSVLFAPPYGQINYWSPVLLYLAREYRRPIYQYLALWDKSMGAIQRTDYITPNDEELLFEMGGYTYVWYDPSVPAKVEDGLPLSAIFEDVSEAYMRDSFVEGATIACIREGNIIVHGGGMPLLIDKHETNFVPKQSKGLTLTDDKVKAAIHCLDADGDACTEQTIELVRPGVVTIRRKTDKELSWWSYGKPVRKDNTLSWPEGMQLKVLKGTIVSYDPIGFFVNKAVGYEKLQLKGAPPIKYPLVIAKPEGSELVIEVRAAQSNQHN